MASPLGKKLDNNLELFMKVRDPKRCYSCQEIGDAVGCTWQNIHYIEQRALRKLFYEAKRRGFMSA